MQVCWTYQVSATGGGKGTGTITNIYNTDITTDVVTAALYLDINIVLDSWRGGRTKVVKDHNSDLIKAFIHNILDPNKFSVVRVLNFGMSDTICSYKSIFILWPFLLQTITTVFNICM